MEVVIDFKAINYLSVIVAAISSFAVGSLWYGPLFGKAWMKENGFSEEDLRKGVNMPALFGGAFVLAFIKAFLLGAVVHGTGIELSGALLFGILFASIWAIAFYATHSLFERTSYRLFTIHAGHDFFGILVMAVILSLWQ